MAISYVGGTSATSTSNGYSVSLTSLTGGSDSAPIAGDVIIVFTAYADNADSRANITITGNNSGSYLSPFASSGASEKVWIADTWGTVGMVAYQVAGATPDTSLTIGRVTDAVYGGGTVVQVFRGVDSFAIYDSSAWQTVINSSRTFGPDIVDNDPSMTVAVFCGAGTLQYLLRLPQRFPSRRTAQPLTLV
jgi:hypothetical protein